MTAESTISGAVKIRPRARLVRLIGEELISDEAVAIVELVKNSYDADAKSVTVRFEGGSSLKPDRIIVEDDGSGMNLETVKTAWLELGTTSKHTMACSPNGRAYQGAKGIGRFAAARLAKNLFMETKTEESDLGVTVLLDWGVFDDTSFLDSIDVVYEVSAMSPRSRKGTKLTLEGLRESWTEEAYQELHSRLSRLVSPFDEITDFEINLIIPEYEQLSGPVQPPQVTLKPKYVLKGTLSTDGIFDGEILIDGEVHKRLEKEKRGKADTKPQCGSFEVEIRVWDRDRTGLDSLATALKTNITAIRGTLNSYCGVSIYRDGLRVHPYGQKGNDWLGLDNRSRQTPGRNLANNQIIGAVKISKSANPELRDRSSREGLVHNSAYEELQKWFIEVISLLEDERYRLRPKKEDPESNSGLFEPFEIAPTLKRVREQIGADTPLGKEVQALSEQVRKGVDRLQEVYSRILMQAGLGHMVDVVIHEIGRPLGKLSKETFLIGARYSSSIPEETRPKFELSLTKMNGWLTEIHTLRERLNPQTPALRGRSTTFDVRDEIKDNLELFNALLKKQKINCQFNAPSDQLRVQMSRAVVGQVVANLLDNSIFWLDRTRGTGKGGDIQIDLENLPSGFMVRVSDSGPGVEPEDRENIFEPYFTKKPDGMGLGLYIAQLVMDPYGRILYQESGPLRGACFEAHFERGVGK